MSAPARRGHLDPRALTARSAQSVGPWSPDHLVGLLAANGIGLLLVFAGWWEAAGLGTARGQLGWLDLSVIGLVVAGGANGLWLARARRVVMLARASMLPLPASGLGWPTVASVTSNCRTATAVPGPGLSPIRRGPVGVSKSESLVAGRGMSRYHRANCLLATGKQVRVAGRAKHERGGRQACEVCRP